MKFSGKMRTMIILNVTKKAIFWNQTSPDFLGLTNTANIYQ